MNMNSTDLLLEQLSTNAGAERFISRRELVRLLGLSMLLGVAGCRSTSIPHGGHSRELEELAETILSLKLSNPGLAGFKDAEKVVPIAFSPDRNAEDTRILAGRLSLEAFQKLKSSFRVSRERVQSVLSAVLPIERFTKTYFDELLSDTKERMRSDRAYRDRIEGFAAQAQQRRTCTCNDSVRCWVCVVIVIAIIAAIIVFA